MHGVLLGDPHGGPRGQEGARLNICAPEAAECDAVAHHAAAAGVSKGRWSNIRNLVFKALNRAGIPTLPGRYRNPLAREWENIRQSLPDRYARTKLSRFMSYCTEKGIRPEDVTVENFEAFAGALDTSMMRDPGATYRETCKVWNSASRTIPGWPQLTVPVPDRRRLFAYDIQTFPASFQADLEGFLMARENPDIFSDSYAKPIKPLTNGTRRQNVLMLATALVRTGFPVERITGLDVLVELENARAALRFLHERAGSRKTGYHHHIATLLKTIAINHVGKTQDDIKALSNICRNLSPKRTGLTDKNRRFLHQFYDPSKLAALLRLPRDLVAEADKHERHRKTEAVRVSYAVAIAIELIVPLRARNLVGLRLDQLPRVGERMMLSISADETKNDNPIVAEFPPWLVRLIDHYVTHYRPRMLSGASSWLLPGENGEKRNPGGFGAQLAKFIAKEIGVTMTLHQFRHLAAKLYLDRNPTDFERARILLGHKSISTTMTFYREFDAVLAVRRYSDIVSELMGTFDQPTAPTKEPRR